MAGGSTPDGPRTLDHDFTPPSMVITNTSRGTTLADRAQVARTLPQRVVGLLSRTGLAPGEALIFPHCNSIHTWFMRFPIDVVFVRQGQVVRTVHTLGPFRLRMARSADTVIELPAGAAARAGLEPGTQLRWDESSL